LMSKGHEWKKKRKKKQNWKENTHKRSKDKKVKYHVFWYLL
jgi:hypothetical protein